MAFSTVPFTGVLVAGGLDVNWCSVSPTKAFLIYTGWTGPLLGQGQRKLFIQAVYFNGKNPATFGPACSVGVVPTSAALFPYIVSLSDGRLFVSMRDNGALFSYAVYNVEAGDLVSLSYKHGTLFTQSGNNTHIAMAALDGNKVLSTQFNTNNNDYVRISVGASSMTFETITGAQLLAYNYVGTPVVLQNLTGHSIRSDRAGNILVTRSFYGAMQAGSPTNGVQFTTFDKDGNVLRYGRANPTLVGGVDYNGFMKGKDVIPISASNLLSLGATSAAGSAAGSAGSEIGFARITLSATTGGEITPSEHISYRDVSPFLFADVIWLDDDYFFAFGFKTPSANVLGVKEAGIWNAADAHKSPEAVYIGKYNAASNSVVMADSMPLALPDVSYAGSPQTNFLHRISNTEVAIIQPAGLASPANSYEIRVTVIGA